MELIMFACICASLAAAGFYSERLNAERDYAEGLEDVLDDLMYDLESMSRPPDLEVTIVSPEPPAPRNSISFKIDRGVNDEEKR